MDSWLDSVLGEGGENPDCHHQSGYKTKVGTKVGTAESLAQKGFHDFVPTVPSVPTEKQSPRSTMGKEKEIRVAIPIDIIELVAEVARLEGLPQDEHAEHLDIIGRQLVSGECDADTIRIGWRAHLNRWHPVRREASKERPVAMKACQVLPGT